MPYSERFDEALVFAHQLHRNQVRKGTTIPYITHLLAVASLVGEHGGDEDQVIAALLHDAIEDQGGERTARAIEQRFGTRVASMVRACSDSFETPKAPWRIRKETFLKRLPTVPEEALIIVLADKVHNARSIVANLEISGQAVWGLFRGARDGTLWYYRAASDILSRRMPSHLAAELGRLVVRMQELAAEGEPPSGRGPS